MYQVGGTSFATPLTAAAPSTSPTKDAPSNGEPSLNGLTQTLPTLYNLSSSDYHDITVGGNGTYNAATWDTTTDKSGLGTPIANVFVNDLGQHEHQLVPHRDPRPGLRLDHRKHVARFSRATTPSPLPIRLRARTPTRSPCRSSNGTLASPASTNNLTFASGANDSSALMTVTGEIGDLQAAVAGLTYTPNPGLRQRRFSSRSNSSDPLANVGSVDDRLTDSRQLSADLDRARHGLSEREQLARLLDG